MNTFAAFVYNLQIEIRAPTEFFAIEYFPLQLKYFNTVSYKIDTWRFRAMVHAKIDGWCHDWQGVFCPSLLPLLFLVSHRQIVHNWIVSSESWRMMGRHSEWTTHTFELHLVCCAMWWRDIKTEIAIFSYFDFTWKTVRMWNTYLLLLDVRSQWLLSSRNLLINACFGQIVVNYISLWQSNARNNELKSESWTVKNLQLNLIFRDYKSMHAYYTLTSCYNMATAPKAAVGKSQERN